MGNRLRALRKTYGFENLVGKNTALGAKTDGAAAATGNKTVNNKSDSAPKRGRPARVKSGTLPASSSTEVATRLEVDVGGDDEEVKSVKRKREDEPTTDVKLENASEQPQPQPQVKKRGRKPASATTSSTTLSTSTTTHMSMAMPPPASIPSTGQMNGSGKANSRTVHFDRMREPSKRRKKQEDSSSSTSCNSSSTNRPSEYIYHIAAETIREARRQRRRARRRSVKSKSKSGLKLVFKVARMRSRSWLASLSFLFLLMDEEVADLTRFLLILLSGLWIEYTRALIFMEYTV